VIIVDTSVWADHLHHPINQLLECIANGEISQHPFVTGELALGNPANSMAMVKMLDTLTQAQIVGHDRLIAFVDSEKIGGTGVGFVDAHLLASAQDHGLRLWTRDKRLSVQAERLGYLYPVR
jgi:predicted nucleic acid-binding protein